MRPKLRADVRYVPTEDGVHVFSATGRFGLTGSSVEPLLDQLVGLLDGTHTVEAIVDGLSSKHRQVVTKLIDTLIERRVAHDADQELPHQLQDWELERYQQEIAFAELAAGSGAHRFERFRHANVLMVGAGGAFDALVDTMLQLGSRGGGVLATARDPGTGARHRQLLAEARRHDPLLGLVEVSPEVLREPVADAGSLLAGFDAVLHCDDLPMFGRATTLTRAARAAGIPALHALVADEHAWVGPTEVNEHHGCWECAWRYRIGALPKGDVGAAADHLADQPVAQPGLRLGTPIGGVVGALLAMAYFRLVTEEGAVHPPASRLVQVELETAITQTHMFHRHPGCRACPRPSAQTEAAFTSRVRSLRNSPSQTDDDLSRAARELHDPALGAILSLQEGANLQFPLAVVTVVVTDITCSGTGPATFTVAGPDQQTARMRAAVCALEAIAPAAGETSSVPGLAWAWDVGAGRAVALDQPGSHCRRSVAAGYSWEEAVGRGLLRHCRTLAIQARHERPAPPAPPAGPARELVDSAEVLGARLRLGELVGVPGTSTVEVHGAPGAPVVVTAPDLDTATTYALEAAVSRLQGAEVTSDVPADLGDESWPDRLPRLLASTAAAGWTSLATPIDLEPTLGVRAPVVVELMFLSNEGNEDG